MFGDRHSLSFDGTDEYLISPFAYDVYNGGTVQPVTFAAWVKKDAWEGASDSGITFGDNDRQMSFNALEYIDVNKWNITVNYGGVGSSSPPQGHNVIIKAASSPIDEWFHIAFTLDATITDGLNTSLIYFNGVLTPDSITDGGGSNRHTKEVEVGQYATFTSTFIGKDRNQSNYWQGEISDAAIWNVVLDADDISAIYNSGKPANLKKANSYNTDRTSNLLGWWRFGDGINDTILSGDLSHSKFGIICDQVGTNAELGSNLATTTSMAEGDDLASAYDEMDLAPGSAISSGKIYRISWITSNWDAGKVKVIIGGSQTTSLGEEGGSNGLHVVHLKTVNGNKCQLKAWNVGGYVADISNIEVREFTGTGHALMTNFDANSDNFGGGI